MAQIDASGMTTGYSAFLSDNIDHDTFLSATAFDYQWETTSGFHIAALSFAGNITSGPIGGTVNAINIGDSSGNPTLSITGIHVNLASIVDTSDAAAMQEKFWEAMLAGATTVIMPNAQSATFDMMGDFVHVNTGTTKSGANDTFTGQSITMHGTVAGDAMAVDANATLNGGDDTFTNVVADNIVGDVGNGFGAAAVVGVVNGGDDTISLTDPSFSTTFILQNVLGDVDQAAPGSIVNGGDDHITLTNLGGVNLIAGDVATGLGATKGGNDIIDFETTIAGRNFGSATNVMGDTSNVDASGGTFTARGGNDSITLNNINVTTVSGDFYSENDATTFGGDDTISIAGTFPLTTPPPPFQITPFLTLVTGDAYAANGTHAFTGGSDQIALTNVTVSSIVGDANSAANLSKFTGGNDTIVYTYDRTNTPASSISIVGDSFNAASDVFVGGTDTITVNLAASVQFAAATIFGDAGSYDAPAIGKFTGGNDTIVANTGPQQAATMYGDAQTLHANDGDFHVTYGNDHLTGGAGNDTIYGDSQSLMLSGSGTIVVNGGTDVLDGRAGNDVLYGGDGIDTAVFSLVQAVFVDLNGIPGSNFQAVGQGNDKLTLIENITGSSKADIIFGEGGNNVLDGAGGADHLAGRDGDDTFIVDNAKDVVSEVAGEGTDTVRTSVSYKLAAGASIETFTTTDQNGTANLKLTGNEIAQTIIGNAGNNTLDGKGGSDLLRGLGGNDTYIVYDAGDDVKEAVGGGTDQVQATVDYVLGAGQEVEQLSTNKASATAAIDLTGNGFGQTIIGNEGSNIINGKAGNDTMSGHGGADTFVFDTALNATTNNDVITDFAPGTDFIQLENAIFDVLPGGTLTNAAFFKGTAAHDASDRVIYDPASGALYYDKDGLGGVAQVQFATLATGLALTHNDIVVT